MIPVQKQHEHTCVMEYFVVSNYVNQTDLDG